MTTKHLKVLGLGNALILGNETKIRTFVERLISELKMTPLGKPTVHNVEIDIRKLGVEPFCDEGGITTQMVGYHTLSTSHIAIHTWPVRDEFHLDIYSCRYFDKEEISRFIGEYFETYKMKVSDLTAATEW